jgi:hypothetical protein
MNVPHIYIPQHTTFSPAMGQYLFTDDREIYNIGNIRPLAHSKFAFNFNLVAIALKRSFTMFDK